jgi:hypothetical protein
LHDKSFPKMDVTQILLAGAEAAHDLRQLVEALPGVKPQCPA